MNRKMQSAVTKTQNRRMQIGKTDNEKAKWGSLGPRHANEIKNWCFGAIGANISRQIQIYTSIYTWIYSLSPACCKQMSFNKLKMWANWRMASERARGWAAGGGAVRGLSPMGVWKVRCFSMPDWFCGVGGGGVCGWQAPPGSQAFRQSGKGNPNAATRKTNAARLPPTFDASFWWSCQSGFDMTMTIETPFCGLVTQSSWLQQAVDIN